MRNLHSISNIFKSSAKLLAYQRRTAATATKDLTVKFTAKDGVAVFKIDTPGSKVNSLSEKLMAEFEQYWKQFQNDPALKSAVIISAKPGCFIAGADINMLAAQKTAESVTALAKNGQEAMDAIEASTKPVVAAIMGSCLGGGNELAMACQYRLAVNDRRTVFSQPEVMLGLLPGAGGTQRLLKMLPLPDALDIMLTGKNVASSKAKRLGLVHDLIEPLGPGLNAPDEITLAHLEKVAIEAAKKLASGQLKPQKKKPSFQQSIMNTLLGFTWFQNYVLKKARATVMKQTAGNFPAPLAMLDVVKTSLSKGSKAGFAAEAKKFGELAMTSQSKALMGLFFGQTECKKNQFGAPVKPVKTLAILGAGLMGAGIAQVSLNRGMQVLVKDMNAEAIARGLHQVQKNYSDLQKKKKMTPFEAERFLADFVPVLDYSKFKKVDMVVEAVFEDLAIKHKVVKEVEQYIPEHCIFATNTSALPVTDIAKASKRPEKVVGMHYFSPVDKMMLLELVKHPKTSKDTLASASAVGLKQGKIVITVNDSPGFYTSRVLGSPMTQAMRMLQEGISPKELDKATRRGGWPVGMATLVDEVGIDIGQHVAEFLGKALFQKRLEGSDAPADVVARELAAFNATKTIYKELVDAGFKGRKSGKGVYLYEDGVKDRNENTDAIDIIKKYPIASKRSLTPELIQKRLLLSFVNEAALILQEGVLMSPREGDVGAVFGLGFPPFLGGPFRYVDLTGADKVVKELNELSELYGLAFKPCTLLQDYARDPSKKFFPAN